MDERLMRDLLENAPAIIAFHDPDHNILWANAAYREATGLSLEEIEGCSCFSVWGLSAPCRNCPATRAIETGERAEAELTPQTQKHWPADQGAWLLAAAPVRDQEGTVIGAVEVAYEITERKRTENEKERTPHHLGERVKELRCLYGVAESIRKRDSIPEMLRDVVELIPPGWHYPEITRGRVTFDGEEYVSEPFEETEWRLAADIVVHGEVRGSVEVFYLEERPELDEGPFMEEERELLQSMARSISAAVERKEANDENRAANQQLRATEQQLRAANQQLDAYNQQLRAAERKLRESKRILDATGKLARIGGWEHDLITGKATWTEALYDIIRIPYDQEPPGVDEYLDYYPPDDREVLRQAYEKAVEEGVPFDLELQVNTAQGDLLWCRVQGEPVYENGRCVTVRGSFQDITERMEAEEALRRSEGKYRAYVENAPEGIFITDKEGAYVDVNEAACRMTGYTRQEMLEMTIRELSAQEAIGEAFEDFYRLRKEGALETELLLERKDGTVFHASLKAVALGDERLMGFCSDITERKRQEAELRTVRQQVMEQERQRALSTMASGIAHDFNNALSTILGFTDLLLESPEELSNEDTVRNYLELIRKAASNAAETVRRMRKFYRPRDDYALKAVDLNALASEAVSMTRPRWQAQAQAEGAGIELEEDFQDTGPVAGHESELHEMLTNLIFNAVDAMPEGGTLSLRTRREGDRIELEVSDTGTGMSEEVRQRCLEPFYTTKREAGSGLGLSTVRGIVERHGGTIGVESAPGEGTTFRIRLPAYETEEGAEDEEEHTREGPEAVKVLVVEDEEDQRLLITKYLEADGHRVTTAADGAQGVEKFLDGWYNVVITDRAMPEMNGAEVARTIRKRTPDKPIIMLTGFGEMMDAAGETLEDVDLVLSKPVTMEELRNALSAVLERKQSGQSAGDDTGER